jgi:hypothetical protein
MARKEATARRLLRGVAGKEEEAQHRAAMQAVAAQEVGLRLLEWTRPEPELLALQQAVTALLGVEAGPLMVVRVQPAAVAAVEALAQVVLVAWAPNGTQHMELAAAAAAAGQPEALVAAMAVAVAGH